MGKFLITENERKHILNLYGLLKEAEPEKGTGASSVSLQDLALDERIEFGPGWYTMKNSYKSDATGAVYKWDVEGEIGPKLTEIKEFLKNNPTGYIVDVILESGESKIPNNDATLPGRPKVEPGYLNTARLNTLKTYLNGVFKTWNDEGVKTDFNISEKVSTGPTEWVNTPFCPTNSTKEQQRNECYVRYTNILKNPKDPNHTKVLDLKNKYDDEQFFRVIITVNKVETQEPEKTPEPPADSKCATGLKIRVHVPRHNCQNAEFFVFANNTQLANSVGGNTANLNNSNTSRGVPSSNTEPVFPPSLLNPGYGFLKNGDGTYGGYSFGNENEKGDIGQGRSDTFTVTSEQSEKIVTEGNGFIDLWFIATTKNAHRDIPIVEISKPDVQGFVFNEQPKVVQGRLLRLDACGKKVLELGTDATVPNLSSAVDDLRRERTSMMEKNLRGKFAAIFQKGKLDGKAILLERADGIADAMSNALYAVLNLLQDEYNRQVAEYKKNNPKDTNLEKFVIQPLPEEIRIKARDMISKEGPYLKEAYNEVRNTGTSEAPITSLTRYVETYPYQYSDKFINKSDLAGDIRDSLNKWYEGYDMLYPESKKGVTKDKWQLTGNTWYGLVKAIKGLKLWGFGNV